MLKNLLKNLNKRYKKSKVKTENSSEYLEMSISSVIQKLDSFQTIDYLLEIGSRDGYDAFRISNLLNIPAKNVAIVEANPECFKFIRKKYPSFKVLNKAVFNTERQLNFNYVFEENIGTSSLFDRNDNFYLDKSRKISVLSITGKSVMKYFNLKGLVFCKIDVEGAACEVLESFGEDLKDLHIIHIECEHVKIWKNQKLYDDIKLLLELHQFKELYFQFVGGVERQSDSIWVNDNLIN